MSAPYVVVEGGLVQDSSTGVSILDLDVLGDEFVDEATVSDVRDMLERVEEGDFPAYISERLRSWLARNAPDPECDGCDQDPWTTCVHYGNCPLVNSW